jgi:hypothetical protein
MANSGRHGAAIQVSADSAVSEGRKSSHPRSGDWLRLRFVNIDRVLEEGWTFADLDPRRLDVCGLPSFPSVGEKRTPSKRKWVLIGDIGQPVTTLNA